MNIYISVEKKKKMLQLSVLYKSKTFVFKLLSSCFVNENKKKLFL